MMLEYAALAGTILLAVGGTALVIGLVLAGRPEDDGRYEAPLGPVLPPEPIACPDCHGRRCAAWRHGTRCDDQTPVSLPAYAAGLPPPRDGRHATSAVVARWLAGDWWDSPLPVQLRRQLGRMAGASRVPVQLGYPLRRLP